MMKDIPIIDPSSSDFKDQLAFNLWSTQSASDYSNDRNRPYNGQPWTDDGVRGQHKVDGITMRDLKDCLIKAMLLSAPLPEKYFEPEEFSRCWDFSTDPPKPTAYLLSNQDEYLATKAETGTWRAQDIFKIDWSKIDPLAIAQNLTCEVERMMGIFPNIPKTNAL